MNYLRIALPVPFYQLFDYANNGLTIEQLQPGIRIRVPFAHREIIGILIEAIHDTDFDKDKIKPIIEALDQTPVFTPHLFSLCQWASDYYHHPLGDVLSHALPTLLRQGKAATIKHNTPEIADRQPESPLSLNPEQQLAVTTITASLSSFKPYLLQGITGSGKTEVYLHCIDAVLKQGKQALILVPEIGLTPQTLARFSKRFNVPMVVLHSRLSPPERLSAWIQVKTGQGKIIIGTRSAILTPAQQLGIIIIDESHDMSFKQQSGFLYSARDLAVRRGQMLQIPVILGSATPSLESLYNAQLKRFTPLSLTQRAGGASTPTFHIIDIRDQPLNSGISKPMIAAIDKHLKNHKQVLLFLNRRGYAPVLICNHCGYAADCEHCDAKMTLHLTPRYLHCHHCDRKRKVTTTCPKCQEANLTPIGVGTEKLEEFLEQEFPEVDIIRVDRDTTHSKKHLDATLTKIQQGHSQILIGTQMLAKGHHFPNVTLVAIIDVDSGLLSPDFRATERMSQLLVQVAGRAGREKEPGEVYLQTRNPEHPSLTTLLKDGYMAFSEKQLQERQSANFPPFSHLALFRCEAPQVKTCMEFLAKAKTYLANDHNVQVLGPIPAPMGKRKGFHRAQLLLNAKHRTQLHTVIKTGLRNIIALKKPVKLRWSLDIDPLDMY